MELTKLTGLSEAETPILQRLIRIRLRSFVATLQKKSEEGEQFSDKEKILYHFINHMFPILIEDFLKSSPVEVIKSIDRMHRGLLYNFCLIAPHHDFRSGKELEKISKRRIDRIERELSAFFTSIPEANNGTVKLLWQNIKALETSFFYPEGDFTQMRDKRFMLFEGDFFVNAILNIKLLYLDQYFEPILELYCLRKGIRSESYNQQIEALINDWNKAANKEESYEPISNLVYFKTEIRTSKDAKKAFAQNMSSLFSYKLKYGINVAKFKPHESISLPNLNVKEEIKKPLINFLRKRVDDSDYPNLIKLIQTGELEITEREIKINCPINEAFGVFSVLHTKSQKTFKKLISNKQKEIAKVLSSCFVDKDGTSISESNVLRKVIKYWIISPEVERRLKPEIDEIIKHYQ